MKYIPYAVILLIAAAVELMFGDPMPTRAVEAEAVSACGVWDKCQGG